MDSETQEYAPGSYAVRRLGPLEEFFWRSGGTSPITIYFTAIVEFSDGGFNWYRAADAVQRKYEHLRLTVDKVAGQRPAYVTTKTPIAIHVLPWEGENVSTPPTCVADSDLGYTTPLLARFIVFEGLEGAQITLAMNHALLDGMGALAIMQDFLAAAVGEALCGEVKLSGSINQLLHADCSDGYKPREHHTLPIRYSGTPRPRIAAAVLPQQTLSLLQQRSRENQTTVHGALVAASFIAARRCFRDWSEKDLVCFSPTNLRRLISPNDPSLHGLLIGVQPTVWKAKDFPGFWDFARRIRQEIASSLEMPSVQAGLRMACSIVDEDGNPDEPEAADPKNLLAHDLMVSNYGSIEVRTDYRNLRLTGLFPAVCGGPDAGTQTISAITIDGALCMTNLSPAPIPGFLSTMLNLLTEVSSVSRHDL